MTRTLTPRSAAAAVAQTPTLPIGAGESVAGFGVMGLPFANGHYLAFRDFPAASFLPTSDPGYRTVWHRDPDGAWTFYATTPPQTSCARYFSSAVRVAHQCRIDSVWTDDYTLVGSQLGGGAPPRSNLGEPTSIGRAGAGGGTPAADR